MNLKDVIRTIPDFPEKGIIFRDITTILQDGHALHSSIEQISEKIKNLDFDLIVGPESRGFIFGVPTAYNLKKGFIPVRKPGKLPAETIKKDYSLEYGTSTLEMHKDAVKKGQNVVIIDDLLATGGTCKAMVEMLEEIGANIVAIVFLIELEELKGIELFKGYNVYSIVKY